MLYYKDFR